MVVNGALLLVMVLLIAGSEAGRRVTGAAWIGHIGGALAAGYLLVLASYVLAMGKRLAVARALLVPLSIAAYGWIVVGYAGVLRIRGRLGPNRELFRAITCLRDGRLEEAALAFERYLPRHPQDLAGLAHATLVSLKLARHEDALRHLDTALSQKRNAEFLVLRALLLSYSGAPEDGLVDIEAALAERPKNGVYHFYRALMLIEARRIDEALEVLSGPARPAKSPDSWYLLSLALTAKGELGKAADAYRRALPIAKVMRIFGPVPWNQMIEAWLLAQMGKLEAAYEAAADTATRNPGDHEALVLQAEVHHRRGETEQALRALEQAGRRNPFVVVEAARDPAFAPLVASPGFPALLGRATSEWEARLLAIRQRPGIAGSGA